MVLDIELFRTKEGIEKVKESQRRRYVHNGEALVDRVTEADQRWKKAEQDVNNFNRMANICSKAVGEKLKKKEPVGDDDTLPNELVEKIPNITQEDLMAKTVAQIKKFKQYIEEQIQKVERLREEIEKERIQLLVQIGNIVHDTAEIAADEDKNKIEKKVGDFAEKKYSHVDLIHMIDGADFEKGTEVAGNRGYFLKGPTVLLEYAIIQLALNLLYSEKFIPLYTPFFMKKDIMQEVAQLSQFDEELYKVHAKTSEMTEDTSIEEKYLIATSEQPIAAFHRHMFIEPKDLPKCYAGVSTCFRQEVGSHGRDTRGIFRVHQFEKVEQFCVTSPIDGESWKMMEKMLGNAELFLNTLEIPYRVVNIVSGALNNAAAKKWDIEGWFPGSKAFRELVSCSNCTDYQSRRLRVKFGYPSGTKDKKQDKKGDNKNNNNNQKKEAENKDKKDEYVHMLNSTMCASTRMLCAILENYQTDVGIVVPNALKRFLPDSFPSVIEFVKQPEPVEKPTLISKKTNKK